jgi:NAD(P)-dependent dehydrogenase (short-subunit alcohol dehydrogenase family)
MDINGMAAIVTGGGSGLGEATARRLAAAGAKVACFDVNEEAANNVAGEIGGIGVNCDVTSGPGAEAAIAEAAEAHGVAKIVINCAGVGVAGKAVGRNGPLPLEDFTRVVNINLIGTFNIIRLTAHAMQKEYPMDDGARGVIVNTASVAAFDGQIGQPAYGSSKGGVAAMTLPLAREFAQWGIRVCTIAPGLFATPMMYILPEEAQKSLGDSVPYPSRLGSADEYAHLAQHICENQMLNGETIRLDGSLRMAPR